jgi:cobalamin biosynthesis protein CobD/CbiB
MTNEIMMQFPMYIILPIFLILFAGDVLMTYFIVKMHRKVFPKSDWKKIELNPIARMLWNKYELFWGTIVSVIIVLPIIIIASFLSSISAFYFGFMLGVYFMTFRIHIASYKQLCKIMKKQGKIKKRRKRN